MGTNRNGARRYGNLSAVPGGIAANGQSSPGLRFHHLHALRSPLFADRQHAIRSRIDSLDATFPAVRIPASTNMSIPAIGATIHRRIVAHNAVPGCGSIGMTPAPLWKGVMQSLRPLKSCASDALSRCAAWEAINCWSTRPALSAVRELRTRKRRFDKPLAVMVNDLAAVERMAILSNSERTALSSPANPIVVVRSRAMVEVAQEVTYGLDTIGVFLPTTALHDDLLRRFGAPLVVTSGNVEGEPLAYSHEASLSAAARARRCLSGSRSARYSAN